MSSKHLGCTGPVPGSWNDYGNGIRCTVCGQPKEVPRCAICLIPVSEHGTIMHDTDVPKSAPAPKKTPARRAPTKRSTA